VDALNEMLVVQNRIEEGAQKLLNMRDLAVRSGRTFPVRAG
jgi:hypothetical protein